MLLWTVATAAASRMRLNASTFYYEPPHLARLLTTLDVLSDGRLDVGVGLGWMKTEHDIVGSADWRRRGEMLDDLLTRSPIASSSRSKARCAGTCAHP